MSRNSILIFYEHKHWCPGMLWSLHPWRYDLGNQLYLSLLEQVGWTRRPPEVPSNLSHFVSCSSVRQYKKHKYLWRYCAIFFLLMSLFICLFEFLVPWIHWVKILEVSMTTGFNFSSHQAVGKVQEFPEELPHWLMRPSPIFEIQL